MRVDSGHVEGQHAGFVGTRRRAEDAHAVQLRERLVGVVGERVFVRAHGRVADAPHVVDRRSQSDHLGDGLGAGLELVRRLPEGGALQTHRADHLATGQERRHGVQQGALAVQHAYARGPAHLVRGKGVEVDVGGLHVEAEVGGALRTVDHHQRTGSMCLGGQFLDGIHSAQRVGDVREGDQPRLLTQQGVELVSA